MARRSLLPANSTPFEVALATTLDPTPGLEAGIADLHAFKFNTPNASILPWLVVEYGLGSISRYLPDLASVIQYGLRWQRVKGTPQGIAEALTWVNYAFADFYEAPIRRTRWHLYELEMDRFRDDEDDLDTIEAVVRLSDPVRSEFFRAYVEYNVREHDWSYSRWGDGIWSDASGVRLHDGGVKWSFGRTFEPVGGFHNLTEDELTAAGAWVEPSEEGASIGWGAFPWETPGLKWVSDGAASRSFVISTALLVKSCWIGIYRADTSPIAFRKARIFRSVEPAFDGYYAAGASRYVAGDGGSLIYVEAMSDFGEGDGEIAASWSITLGAALPEGVAPGTQWLEGNPPVGGTIIGGFAIAEPATFGKTSRERFRTILKIV